MRPPQDKLRCICATTSKTGQAVISSPADVDSITRDCSRDALHNSLVKICPADTWTGNCHLSSCPFPILVNSLHQRQLLELNEALVKAITDIVSRWWSDKAARLSERMPLQPREEKLLRWLDSQETGDIRPFKECMGSWRPDFLVEEPVDLTNGCVENFRICEINARFSWNGYMLSALGQKALLDMGICRSEIMGGTNPRKILNGLQRLYDPQSPVYLLKGKEHGYDIHLYAHYASQHLGQRIRFIAPEELKLIPCHQSRGGYKLYCLVDPHSPANESNATLLHTEAGEILEEINQVGLELHQDEILALSDEMLQQVSLRCFNDMRTVLLVHDKRMLGIVLEELDSLVVRKILLPSEASLLDRGICHTILPGSTLMARLLEECRLQPSLKDEYILKPVRGGKGEGILFGDDMTFESWMTCLEGMKSPYLSPQGSTMVIQRRIRQAKYEVFLQEKAGLQCLPIVGTYHAVHGEFLGIGVWRSSPGSVCAISHGGAWMCSVMQRDT
ncbi:hypothetical protein N7447_002598 [Penicillium robsamsonii]|uniref:uncharacterized protein n=1 Tax=Penicillium robsamsonii TaxID=1792511 RepID=UPI0025482572|nr:uncharacterized protein N7447_002598 [Penicillium robsamsonii]KAJ5836572.1 hypothetical protein N7447_002598 [Penicillium robsamsonii]